MPFSVTLFDLVVLLGILQGIAMSILFVFLRVNDKSKTLLILILLEIALLSSKILLHTLGLWNRPAFRYFPLAIDTTLQPLLYLYACAITAKPVALYKKLAMFIPTLVFMVHAVAVYVMVLPIPNLHDKDVLAESYHYNAVKEMEDWVAILSGVIYWVLSYRRIQQYRNWLFSSQSDTRFAELGWIRNILLTTGILVPALTVVVILESRFNFSRHHFFALEAFYFYLAFITYYLSLKGYQFYNSARADLSVAANAAQAIGEQAHKTIEDLELIKAAIITALDDGRLFLQPELSLKDLSKYIDHPVATVSAAINQGFGINFRNLVNQYRVDEVKRRLADPDLAHLSLLGIALECGFNSEASFYRIFRKATGLSPNDYIRRHLKQ